jgi:hypothetical protein
MNADPDAQDLARSFVGLDREVHPPSAGRSSFTETSRP